MSGLPEINAVGTLVADPELKYTPSGAGVANFTIACNDRRLDKASGEWKDMGATFLRCAVWRTLAENVAESLRRGDRVHVIGTLRQRDWKTDAGEKRSAFEVDVTEVGPSLKWATAKVAKAGRSNGGGLAPGDPWSSEPAPAGAASGGGFSDEPPF